MYKRMQVELRYKRRLALVLLYGFLCLCAGDVNAQTPKSDFERLNKHYVSLKQLGYEAHYTLYGENMVKPLESFEMVFKRAGYNFYSRSVDEEFLINERYVLFVDHEDKEVVIQKNVKKKQANAPTFQDLTLYLDSLISAYSKIELLKGVGDVKQYRLIPLGGIYEKVDLSIDTKTWFLRDMTLYFAELEEVEDKPVQVHIKVEFKNYVTSGLNMGVFSELNYLSGSPGVFKLKANYGNYVLQDETK